MPMPSAHSTLSGHAVHLAHRQLRQSANYSDQVPDVIVAQLPGRHSRKANAVFDDVEKCSIRHRLCGLFPKVGTRWIEPCPDFGFTATVHGMAHCTSLYEVVRSCGQAFRIWWYGVMHVGGAGRNCKCSEMPGDVGLHRRWPGCRAEPVSLEPDQRPNHAHSTKQSRRADYLQSRSHGPASQNYGFGAVLRGPDAAAIRETLRLPPSKSPLSVTV